MISWVLVLVGFVNAVLGLTVFKQVQKTFDRWIFIILLLASTVWAWSIAAFLLASSIDRAQIYVDVYYIAALVISSCMLAFALYDRGARNRATFLALLMPIAIWVIYICINPHEPVKVISVSALLNDRVSISPVSYTMYALTFIAISMPALDIFFRNAFASTGRARQRRLLLANGMLVAGVFGIIFNLILPGFNVYEFIGVGPLFSVAFTLAATYSIVHYSLFDLKQSFMRSFVYILALATTVTVYGLLSWAFEYVFKTIPLQSEARSLIDIALFAVSATLFEPIRRRLGAVGDNIIMNKEYDIQDVLQRLGVVMSENIEIDELSTKFLNLLRLVLKPRFIRLQLINQYDHTTYAKSVGVGAVKVPLEGLELTRSYDNQTVVLLDREGDMSTETARLKSADVALIVTLRTVRGATGHLFIGDKVDGSAFSRRDAELLSIVANEVSLAVENSMRYSVIQGFNSLLEGRVEEATQELRASNKKLKVMDQTKDEFISLTSHQLRTPLTTVKGYLSMLMEGDAGELTEPQRKLIQEAFNSSQRMVHLISDFLNISRIQTGKFVIELADVNLADILDEEIGQLRISANSRQINLKYDKPSNFPVMPIDESKIRQVMMNFIDNAIYYSPAGSTITIILSHTASTIEFRVVDQGIGVPKAEQHKLFAKFSRASNARKQRPDGTGIGLFMAKKVIVALGGAIIFQSVEGKGSTFGFRLNR